MVLIPLLLGLEIADVENRVLIMTLKAKKYRWPFIVLALMVVTPISIHLWVFVRVADFSINAFLPLFETWGVILILGYCLGVHLIKLQSVELTDEGVWSLVWMRPVAGKIFPRLSNNLLKWEDMQRWAVTTHLIYLYGPRYKVVINTLLFKNDKEVIEFINAATMTK